MRTIALTATGETLPSTRSRPGPVPAGALVIRDDAIVYDADTDAPLLITRTSDGRYADVLGRALRHVRFAERAPRLDGTASGESRLSGIAVSNSTFGYLPPVPLRRRYGCSRCAFDAAYPGVLTLLLDLAGRADVLLDQMPGADAMRALTAGIAPAWRLADTPWTSGVINNNTALAYHRDASNVRGMWSALFVTRRSCDGGWLHLPAYDVYLSLPNGALALFDGGQVLHGVTPFRLVRPDGYRYSVVLYTRAGMTACSPDPADEPARAARAAAAAARARLETAHG